VNPAKDVRARGEAGAAGVAGGREAAAVAYEALSLPFQVRSESPEAAKAVDLVYREMRGLSGEAPRLTVEVLGPSPEGERELILDGESLLRSPRLGDVIHELDNHLSIRFARARPDLYFVHGGALAAGGKAILLAGESGAGKSTLTYALASAGLEYLTDELSGIEPGTGLVHPYPRAICLKQDPPAPLRLPAQGWLRTEWTLHVSARALSAPVARGPSPLEKIFFIRYAPERKAPALRRLSTGEASLRLYQNALNQLAHPECGLDTTLDLVRGARSYELLSAGIEDTVRAVLNG
jgi:hypothetical protein